VSNEVWVEDEVVTNDLESGTPIAYVLWIMVDGLFQQTNYQAAKALMGAVELRHEAISANLAHVETPHYKRVDIDKKFEKQFVSMLKGGASEQFSGLRPTVSVDQLSKPNRSDGNTVELEKEMLALNRNTLQHGFITDRISGTMARLKLAITGRS
jgi:flagellar basal-body rod protein FlgB